MEIKPVRSAFFAAALLPAALCAAAGAAEKPAPPRNVVIIGWDGAQRAHMQALYDAGELPNLKALAAEGSLALSSVSSGRTETKPGWAEMLTGYRSDRLGIHNNNVYRPIPPGYTVFERVKERYGKGVKTLFLSGKMNNLGARGPHEMCLNCIHRNIKGDRKKTAWWDKKDFKSAGTLDGKAPNWVAREGEPYFNAKKTLDLYAVGLGPGENVAARALKALKKYRKRPFLAFFHFEEPDEQGHLFGENSAEYSAALRAADRWLGELAARLRELGLYEKTVIYVTVDHGMDEAGYEHFNAPHMMTAVNSGRTLRDGDRKDLAPTVLEDLGIDPAGLVPPLDGNSLRIK